MGEIPKTVIVKFDDGDEELTIFACDYCQKYFGVAGIPEENPICPTCGNNRSVDLIVEYT